MFSKLALIAVTAFAAFAAASPVARSQCNTGSQQCCNTVQSASSAAADPANAAFIAALSAVAADVLVGLDCSPISVIGLGGSSSCSANPVCCGNSVQNGLVNLGCTPISA